MVTNPNKSVDGVYTTYKTKSGKTVIKNGCVSCGCKPTKCRDIMSPDYQEINNGRLISGYANGSKQIRFICSNCEE